ncbi:hypothetical protein JCM5296_004695 [Sporobolomyces johnsonii]
MPRRLHRSHADSDSSDDDGQSTGSASTATSTDTDSSRDSGSSVGISVADTSFASVTHAAWFCAVPGTAAEQGALTMGETTDGQAKDWVAAAQKANVKAMLTVGGWSGSSTFTTLMATNQSRSDFVNTLSTALDTYGFDGIDIDWEYPGAAGDTNDFDTANDLNNLLLFFQELRAKIGTDKLISADTSSTVWVGSDGSPSTDLSAFGDVLDFITIMTYDSITYSSTTTGPNFAYSSSCAPSADAFAIPKTVQAWITAKFPADKIMLGLASYGYAWMVANFENGGGVTGASSSIYQTASSILTATDGSVIYSNISSNVRLPFRVFCSRVCSPSEQSDPARQYLSTMTRTFDNCTSTPFLYDSDTTLFIAYDDEESFTVKGGYAGQNGLMGCSIYASLTQDPDGKLAAAAAKVC